MKKKWEQIVGNSKMRQYTAMRADNPTSDNDHCLLLEEYKHDETPAENGEEKFEKQDTEATAERYSKAKYNHKPMHRG